MSHSDDQGLLTHVVSSGGDDVTDSVTETSGTEIRDSGSSHMHAKLFAFYPGKKRLCYSQTIGKVILDNELTVKELVTILWSVCLVVRPLIYHA